MLMSSDAKGAAGVSMLARTLTLVLVYPVTKCSEISANRTAGLRPQHLRRPIDAAHTHLTRSKLQVSSRGSLSSRHRCNHAKSTLQCDPSKESGHMWLSGTTICSASLKYCVNRFHAPLFDSPCDSGSPPARPLSATRKPHSCLNWPSK